MKLGTDCYGNKVEIVSVMKSGYFIVKRYQHWNKSAYVTVGIRDIVEVA